jgi:hypothetical protein
MATTDYDPIPGGNGVKLPNGMWVPKNHPMALAAGVKPTDPATAQPTNPTTPNTAPAPSVPGQTVQGQQQASSYYSPAPVNPETMNTMNQGSQDVYRNSLTQMATQGTNIDMNSPVIRQQQDAFEAAQERSRRNQVADSAEAMNARGLGNSGAANMEERMMNENAQQNDAQFSAQLAANELSNRRDEIRWALASMGSAINGDQARMLQEELAKIEEKLGYADLALRGELGRGSLANERLSINNQNTQANNRLGFDIGNAQMGYNQDALLALLRG